MVNKRSRTDIPRSTILIDVGSSTVKAYQQTRTTFRSLTQQSISLKKGLDPATGISQGNKDRLLELVEGLQKDYPDEGFRIFATAVFRLFTPEVRTSWIDEFFEKTKLYFNIIDQDLENFYLEMALVGKCLLTEPILLINIGGGSTELVVIQNKQVLERINLKLGVGNINQQFPWVNQPRAKTGLAKLTGYIRGQLPSLTHPCRIAFYTGGELSFMQLVNYPLTQNGLFRDPDHPAVIFIQQFAQKNIELFDKISLTKLKALMPANPTWMHGARACSAIAQAICERYHIATIIPSDSNLINGAIRQEFRQVTLSGSFRKHLKYILEIKKQLEHNGARVLSPRFSDPKNPGEEFVTFTGEEGRSPLELERHHLNSIAKSDALIVCDPGGYVGASALIEIGFANALGKRIIFTEEPEEYMLNTLPREVGL